MDSQGLKCKNMLHVPQHLGPDIHSRHDEALNRFECNDPPPSMTHRHTARSFGSRSMTQAQAVSHRHSRVGAGARCAHGAHRSGQLYSFHHPIGPSQKGTRQQRWHQEKSQEMGITSFSCSLNLIWIVHSKMIDVQQLFIKLPGAPCQVQIWKTLRGMGMGSECGTRGGGVQKYHESPPSH